MSLEALENIPGSKVLSYRPILAFGSCWDVHKILFETHHGDECGAEGVVRDGLVRLHEHLLLSAASTSSGLMNHSDCKAMLLSNY